MPHIPYEIGLAICTPIPFEKTATGTIATAMVSVEWHRARAALTMPTNYNLVEVFIDGEEVGDARNIAVQKIMGHNPRPKYLFFLDYDVIPERDAITKLVFCAEQHPNRDIFAGVYCSKGSPPEPLIYEDDGQGPFWDWTVGDILFNITGVHMGLTLIRTSLFERLKWDERNPLFLTEDITEVKNGGVCRKRGTEDLYFCRRVRQELDRERILINTGVLAGHMNYSTRVVSGLPNDSLPVKRARWLRFGEEKPEDKPKLKALDLGAGDYRREWKGYETFTTDLRPDTKPDYVMDSLLLNLPDGSFDLVASSHHLEHLPRFEQERVWSEIFRVCKPGGKIEHIVPNAEWAAAKLIEVEGGRDKDGYEDLLNVLYGAQESHGYDRNLNLHFFCYTAAIGKALAEQAGFVDVECEGYKQVPEHGYNLVIKGRKLAVGEEKPAEKKIDMPAAIEKRLKPAKAKKVETNGVHKKRKLTKAR